MKRFFYKKLSIILYMAVAFASCKVREFEPPQTFDFVVSRPDRDTTFSLSPAITPYYMQYNYESNLSHLALLSWAEDSLFKPNGGIAIKPGEASLGIVRSELFSKKAFIKYVSTSDSAKGKLNLKVTIRPEN